MDFISDLPNHLIWKIYSFLPTKDVATSSILSHHWYRVWSTYERVYLKFEFQKYFSDTSTLPFAPIILDSQEQRFLNLIHKSIQKRLGYETRGYGFERCSLQINFHNPETLKESLVDWIALILAREVPIFSLLLDLFTIQARSFFTLPFIHADHMTALNLKGCSVCTFNLVLPNLRRLFISHCRFESNKSSETLFQGFGRVRYIKISFSENISHLHISNLPSLTTLEFLWCQDIKSVRINASSLRAFCFACWERVKGSFNLACNALEELEMTGVSLNDEVSFSNLISTLPNLQILSLKACVGGLDFSCGSLTKLELQDVHFIGECNVVTPKLQNLESHYGPLFVPTCAPSNLKSSVTFEVQTITNLRPNAIFLVHKITIGRLITWRDFLLQLTGQKDIRLVICLEYEDLCGREVLEMENISIENLGNILQSLLQEITRVEGSKKEMMDAKTLEKISRDIVQNCSYTMCISTSLRKLSDLVEIRRKLTSQDY